MVSNRKAKFVRQIWLTAVSLAVVAIAIFVLSLNFAQPTSNAGASCAPSATPVTGAPGAPGLSAYDLWIVEGNTGTKSEFLASLIGQQGPRGYTGSNGVTNALGLNSNPGASGAPGEPGPSAYQLWLDAGNVGEPEDFLVSLIGTAGANGVDGAAGVDGMNGIDGLSAYELWLSNGNEGDSEAFLASLVGEPGAPGHDGADGSDGVNGSSAYEIWLSAGNSGTEQDFIDSLKGVPGVCQVGDRGLSAYEIWLAQGNEGTEQDFLNSLRGAAGSGGLPYNGSFYDTTTQRNLATPNLMRYNTTDPWTAGIRINETTKSRIYFDHPGVYNIQFSTQFAKTDSGTDFINIWLRRNGSDVPMSNTQLRSWGNDDRQVAAWNFFVEANAGDYYEIAWKTQDPDISMLATAANGMPGIPSVILTVAQVR